MPRCSRSANGRPGSGVSLPPIPACPPLALQNDIICIPVAADIAAVRDGWALVGRVADAPNILDVWWHQATDRVRVARPVETSRPAPAVLTGPPLYQVDPVTTKAGIRPFTARQGFIYTFDGIDYDAGEAER